MPEVVVGPSANFEIGVNCMLHSAILFAALIGLFMVLVAKVGENAMNTEVKHAIGPNLKAALVKHNNETHGQLKRTLKSIDPGLAMMESTVQRPDEATKNFNDGLYMSSFMVLGIFITTLIVMLMVMWLESKVSVWHMFRNVLLGNLIAFAVIGAIEYTFFTMVAAKYVPTKPSLITKSVLDSVKSQFK